MKKFELLYKIVHMNRTGIFKDQLNAEYNFYDDKKYQASQWQIYQAMAQQACLVAAQNRANLAARQNIYEAFGAASKLFGF